jgi:hypothetical protein
MGLDAVGEAFIASTATRAASDVISELSLFDLVWREYNFFAILAKGLALGMKENLANKNDSVIM